jgi:hypothetical protein
VLPPGFYPPLGAASAAASAAAPEAESKKRSRANAAAPGKSFLRRSASADAILSSEEAPPPAPNIVSAALLDGRISARLANQARNEMIDAIRSDDAAAAASTGGGGGGTAAAAAPALLSLPTSSVISYFSILMPSFDLGWNINTDTNASGITEQALDTLPLAFSLQGGDARSLEARRIAGLRSVGRHLKGGARRTRRNKHRRNRRFTLRNKQLNHRKTQRRN